MDSVYIEKTIFGHVTGRIHPDPLIAARQQFTRQWWPRISAQFRLLVSQLVRDECGSGDPDAATERLAEIQTIESLEINPVIKALADQLMMTGAIFPSEPRD